MGSVFTNFHAGCHGPVPLETTIGSEDVGDLKRSFDVLVDQQDRLALRRQAFDRLVDDGRDAWLDASGGLVDDQDGIVHQAAGDLKLALLSAAQRASRLPAPVTQHRELFARSADQLVNASALAAVAPGAQPQVHLDAEIAERCSAAAADRRRWAAPSRAPRWTSTAARP